MRLRPCPMVLIEFPQMKNPAMRTFHERVELLSRLFCQFDLNDFEFVVTRGPRKHPNRNHSSGPLRVSVATVSPRASLNYSNRNNSATGTLNAFASLLRVLSVRFF